MSLDRNSGLVQKIDRKGRRIDGVGLALSGGGFRATLFHLGSLWRLNELGWLQKLKEVNSVSGGSITAGYLGYRWKDLAFNSDGVATNFVDEIVKPLRDFCSHNIDVGSILGVLLPPFHSSIERLASYYRKGLFDDAMLKDLPDKGVGPFFTLDATSLQTGALVRLTRENVADYRLGKFKVNDIKLATAVAASSAFPLCFGPVKIKVKPDDWIEKEKVDDPEPEKLRSAIMLTDGGVYDNLGLERIWRRYSTVLVSDAGALLSPGQVSVMLLLQAKRASDIISGQATSLRKRWLMSDFEEKKMAGTYWGIATKIRHYDLEKNGCLPPIIDDSEGTGSLSRIRTRLNRFTPAEQEKLINWAYALTDAAMRRYVLESGATPGQLPFPQRLP
ncbi:MAG: patatin-like phospholipase family protein [Chloroflexi bacterium]|nr:patatin-like phospholipase family protein [Chloroflexota bacterium]